MAIYVNSSDDWFLPINQKYQQFSVYNHGQKYRGFYSHNSGLYKNYLKDEITLKVYFKNSRLSRSVHTFEKQEFAIVLLLKGSCPTGIIVEDCVFQQYDF